MLSGGSNEAELTQRNEPEIYFSTDRNELPTGPVNTDYCR